MKLHTHTDQMFYFMADCEMLATWPFGWRQVARSGAVPKPQQKPLMSASWQNMLKTVHHIGCCFFLLAMSKGVPALKDHQKLDKSYGWGPSFPPQNPGLKPGAWGWNLEPGVETWRFVKKPLETHGWSMKCWISPSTSRSKTTKLKLDRIHPPQN